MPDLTFDFVWYRDVKGYQLIPGKEPIRRRGQSVEEWLLNARLDDIQPPRIVRKGGKLQRYRPLEIPDLFKRFITMARSPEGVSEFVETHGPLTRQGLLTREQVEERLKREETYIRGLQEKLTSEQLKERRTRRKPQEKEGDDVFHVIAQAEEMLERLRGGWGIGVMPLNKLSVSIETNGSGKIELKVRPACLLDAMWLQLAQSQSAPNIRECPQCHKSFMVGGGGRAQRRDAKFCSDECRIKFNSLARSRHHA